MLSPDQISHHHGSGSRLSSVVAIPTVLVPPKPQFDPDDGRYHCCCGCCHVTTGLKLIAILELFLLAFQLVAISVVYAEIHDRVTSGNFSMKYQSGEEDSEMLIQFYRIFEQNPEVSLAAGVCSATIGLAVIVLMLIGLRKDVAKYILPHLVCQVLAILALLAAGGVVIHGAVTVPDRIGTVDKNVQWTALVVLLTFLALFLIAVCIVVYFTFVVWTGYKFVNARREFESAMAAYAFCYSHPNRNPSMAPSAILASSGGLGSGGSSPRGSTLMLSPAPVGAGGPRGSFLMVQYQN